MPGQKVSKRSKNKRTKSHLLHLSEPEVFAGNHDNRLNLGNIVLLVYGMGHRKGFGTKLKQDFTDNKMI